MSRTSEGKKKPRGLSAAGRPISAALALDRRPAAANKEDDDKKQADDAEREARRAHDAAADRESRGERVAAT